MKVALITGITGQDGSYLAELLLSKGYEVHGVIRRASQFNTDRIDHLYVDPHEPSANLFLHYGDLLDGAGLRRIIAETNPDEIYHLGAQSHVKVSFEQPSYTANTDAVGTLRLLRYAPLFSGPQVERVPELQFQRPAHEVSLSAPDADRRGIATGDTVSLRSNGTSVELRARVDRKLVEGVARIAAEHAGDLHLDVEVVKA